MLSGRLMVDPELLQSMGHDLIAQANSLQDQLQQIRIKANPDGIWEGHAATTYQSQFDRWSASQIEMIDSLTQMGQFLLSAGNAYATVNQQLMQALGLGG